MLRCGCVGRGRHVAEEHGKTLARDGLATLEWIERYLDRVRDLPVLAQVTGWRYAFVVLAPGPILGCLAMRALRQLPESAKLAAGRR